jgi:hypothetical protein
MKKIPQYNDLKEKYCMHTKLISDLFDIYKQRGLQAVGELEQTIVTGMNPKGNREADELIFANLMNQLSREKQNETRARLICLALLCLNVGKKEKMDLEMMLTALGPGYKNLPRGLSFLTGGQTVPKLRENKDNPNLILDRHCPRLESILNEVLVRGGKGDLKFIKINTDDKGIIGDRNMVVRKKLGREDQVADNPKVIIYFVGGIGFNEIRSANKFAGKYTVLCGSNQIISPNAYLK